MELLYSTLFRLKKIYWFIARPKRSGVKCVLTNNDKVLMLQRSFGTDKYVFPGGAIISGESPEEALRRELKEDLDIDLPDKLKFLGEFKQNVHYRRETLYCFTTPVKLSGFNFDGKKIKRTAWFDPKEIPYLTPVSKSVLDKYLKLNV